MRYFYTAIYCIALTNQVDAQLNLVAETPSHVCALWWDLDGEQTIPHLAESYTYIYEGYLPKTLNGHVTLDYKLHRTTEFARPRVYIDYQGSIDTLIDYHERSILHGYNFWIKNPYYKHGEKDHSKWFNSGNIETPYEIEATREITNYYVDSNVVGDNYFTLQLTEQINAPIILVLKVVKKDLVDIEYWRQNHKMPKTINFRGGL